MKYQTETTLASEVVTAGTFTVSYPENTSAGNFVGGKEHKMLAQNALFTAPADFTVAFGASSATVTYNGATTLAAGARVVVELDAAGEGVIDGLLESASAMTLMRIDLGSPNTADDDYFATALAAEATAQTHDTADLLFTEMPDGIARNIVLTGTAGSDHVVTVIGTDAYGDVLRENFTLNGTGVISGKKAFLTITNVNVAVGQAGDTFKVGFGDVLGLPVYVRDARQIVAELVDNVITPRKGDVLRVPFQITEAEMDAAGSFWVVPGFAGSIIGAATVVENTVTTGGSITFEIGGTAVDGLTVVVADASSAGDVDTATATAGHASVAFSATQAIEIVVPANFNASAPLNGYIEVSRSNPLDGTFVAGLAVGTESTATTADVRGTYDPALAANATRGFSLLVMVDDPKFLGNPQYAG